MKPTVREIYERIDEYAPYGYACDWDNSGIQVGDMESDVERILVALDLDDDVTSAACEGHYDLIVTHHPLIFDPMTKVTKDDFIGRRVMRLIESHISAIAVHTNYDVAVMGKLASSRYNMKNVEPL